MSGWAPVWCSLGIQNVLLTAVRSRRSSLLYPFQIYQFDHCHFIIIDLLKLIASATGIEAPFNIKLDHWLVMEDISDGASVIFWILIFYRTSNTISSFFSIAQCCNTNYFSTIIDNVLFLKLWSVRLVLRSKNNLAKSQVSPRWWGQSFARQSTPNRAFFQRIEIYQK